MSQNLTEQQKELIEKIGVFHEQNGMQPLMGRILGLLLVLEDAEATFEEIIDYLKVSKSAVSTALNFMQIKKQVAYRTKPGERKRYFYLTIKHWERDVEKELLQIVEIKKLFKDVIAIRGNKKPEVNQSIHELCLFLEYLNSRIPVLFENFKKELKKS